MKRFIAGLLMSGLMIPQLGAIVPPSCFNDSHDITSLTSWGPYSKRYAGISHIPDIKKGIRFDFSVMPGYYRNRQLVPHVLFESSYYPWNINPSMNRITYRYELEWKDRVFTDVTYYILDESSTLVGIRCVNNTETYQNLALNQMAYIDYPEAHPQVKASGASRLQWYSAIDYTENEPAFKTPQYGLVYDGWYRNEERSSFSLDGSVLGKGFGKDAGDRVSYRIDIPSGMEDGAIGFRYKVEKGKTATLRLKGLTDEVVKFIGTGDFTILPISYYGRKSGEYILELISEGTAEICLDGFFIGTAEDMGKLKFTPTAIPFTPIIEVGNEKQDFILKYEDCENFYGVAWNYKESFIREVLNSELESFFRKKTHDHLARKLIGDKQWHYTNAFLRPVVLAPHSEQTLYMLVCTGSREKVRQDLELFHSTPEKFVSLAQSQQPVKPEETLLPGGKKYSFGHQLLQAALLSNVVYPVYTQKEYIRHFTPGKNWNSLYTWDLGFIALGMIDVDITKAFECIRAYTTPVGSESAFIHHGTPLPIQMYAYYDLWNNSQSREVLKFLYPRLKQYFDFMLGNNPNSTTRMKGSGLLRTWDYFYNSGGWDDYPPQQALRSDKSQYPFVTPVVTSAYYLRAAKILRLAAKEMGLKEDIKSYDRIIKNLSKALQTYAWDEESGYFGYVTHDASGDAKAIFRYKDQSNFNKGLDGVTPLAAGICTPEQVDRLMGHLFSPKELWTSSGLSTVDQSAPYYQADGYWNGAVWFPHQWVIWKALLDIGKGEQAYQIAQTALDKWEQECQESYYTFEHFIISSGRGAGWHQFSGLSSPILNWFAAYYKPGKVSTGFEIWIAENHFNTDYSQYRAKISFDDSTLPHERCMIVCMNPDHTYEVQFNGRPVKSKSYHTGVVEITLPNSNKTGVLTISALK